MSENQVPPSIEAFFTKDRANEGVIVDLPLPNGKPSGATLHLLHRDSDAYRKAQAKYRKTLVKQDAKTTDEEEARAGRELVASVVVSWSLSTPCTTENVVKLFENAPYLLDFVEGKLLSGEDFFKD